MDLMVCVLMGVCVSVCGRVCGCMYVGGVCVGVFVCLETTGPPVAFRTGIIRLG